MGRHRNDFRNRLRHWNKRGASADAVLRALLQRKQSELRKYFGGKLHSATLYADEHGDRQCHHFAGCCHRRGIHCLRLHRRRDSRCGSEPCAHCEFCASNRGRRGRQSQYCDHGDQFSGNNFAERHGHTGADLGHAFKRQLWQRHCRHNRHTNTHHPEFRHGDS